MEELSRLFEQLTEQKPEHITKLAASGSNRAYYRLSAGTTSVIGVKGESAIENKSFIELAKHFHSKALPTPKVYSHTIDYFYYLQEDLGDISLFEAVGNGIKTGEFSDIEKNLLFRTIQLLPCMQFDGAQGLDFSHCYPQPEFDHRTIMWDLNYFKYSFLKTSELDFLEPALEDDFERLAKDLLADNSNTFLYRDFQARNVMLKDGHPYFIDFQGGRKGPIYYDVASFIWQAKANYPKELKEELISNYLEVLKVYRTVDETDFRNKLNLFVLFRTMQVLGAYGFRGYFEKKPHFIESIPFAIKNLRELLHEVDFSAYSYLRSILMELCEMDKFKLEPAKKLDTSILKVDIYSFSYKKGIPEDTTDNGGGYVFDCRSIHNPGRYDEYKPLTGLDNPVIAYLENDGEIIDFLEQVYPMADFHVKRYIDRGFSHLMFSFGCTGGRHRSVYSAQHLAEHISKKYGVEVRLHHREQGIEEFFPAK